MKKILLSLFLLSTILEANGQTFKGLTAFKDLIEFEAQRFLMEEIYNISSEDEVSLKISRTIKDIDETEGFMFVLTSYVYDGQIGAVITTFNTTNQPEADYSFVNIHFTESEFENLYNSLKQIPVEELKETDDHVLKRFNDRVILDKWVSGQSNDVLYIQYTLWIDNRTRHTFSRSKWDRAFEKHLKFVE